MTIYTLTRRIHNIIRIAFFTSGFVFTVHTTCGTFFTFWCICFIVSKFTSITSSYLRSETGFAELMTILIFAFIIYLFIIFLAIYTIISSILTRKIIFINTIIMKFKYFTMFCRKSDRVGKRYCKGSILGYRSYIHFINHQCRIYNMGDKLYMSLLWYPNSNTLRNISHKQYQKYIKYRNQDK